MFVSTLVGMTVGHHGYLLLLASAVWSFVYGLLSARAAGLAWVGQQAAVTLFVTSAFPAGPRAAFIRALLILAGGALQILVTSACLRLFPELKFGLLELHYITIGGPLRDTTDVFFHSESETRRRPTQASPPDPARASAHLPRRGFRIRAATHPHGRHCRGSLPPSRHTVRILDSHDRLAGPEARLLRDLQSRPDAHRRHSCRGWTLHICSRALADPAADSCHACDTLRLLGLRHELGKLWPVFDVPLRPTSSSCSR